MEFSLGGTGPVTKKPRTATPRRPPRPDSQLVFGNDFSRDNTRRFSPGQNEGHGSGARKKEFYLNDHVARASSSACKVEGAPASRKVRKDDNSIVGSDGFRENRDSWDGQSGHNEQRRKRSDLKPPSEGALTPPVRRAVGGSKENCEVQLGSPDGGLGKNSDAYNAENKLMKVKLKVGGVTRTIHANSNEDASNDTLGGSSEKPSRSMDVSRSQKKPILQNNCATPPERRNGLQGGHQKISSAVSLSRDVNENSRRKVKEEGLSGKCTERTNSMSSTEAVRKSNRVPKKRVLDEDDEVGYLEILKTSKMCTNYPVEQENVGDDLKKRTLSKGSKSRNTPYEVDDDYDVSRQPKDSRKKSRFVKESVDIDYGEEEEPVSDGDPESRKNLMANDVRAEPLKTRPFTTRQQTLQSGKDGAGTSSIEFPDGLPPPPSRKQTDKLTEEEKQAKKAEQALRRKLQVEKQAKEELEATIRKILGVNSDRKKEEKNKKELEEKAKAAELEVPKLGTVRWTMGPTGTVVTFAEDVELPSIFNSKSCSYPPPREKCAGPSCTNTFRYRDSKSNLPLCSLECYRAVRGSFN